MVTQKLPAWVEAGGFTLTLTAGAVNAIGLLGFSHQAVSHLTGTSTLLGMAIVDGHFADIQHLLLIILCFLLGAGLSGFIIRKATLRLGRRYGVTLFIEAVFFTIALWLLNNGSTAGHFWASAGCGLQNAMASTYSNSAVRTTHVSGTFTDLGVMFGLWLRGERPDFRKMKLYIILISGFTLGGVLGGYLFEFYYYNALLLPILLCLGMSFTYVIYRRYLQTHQ